MLFEKYQKAVKEKDNYGMLPLHHALYCKASPNIIKMLFEAYPEAVKEKDCFYGMLPLYVALRHEASPDIITMLFAAYPEASEVKNTDGNLPLHIAVKYHASPDKIKMLVNAFPESIAIKNQDGQLPIDLYKADQSKFQHLFTLLNLEQHQQLQQHEQLFNVPPRECYNDNKSAPSSSDGKNKENDSKILHTKVFMSNTSDKTRVPKKNQEHQIHSTTSITPPNNTTSIASVTSPTNTTLNTSLEYTDNMSDVTSDVVKNSHAVSSYESLAIMQHLQVDKESPSVFPFVVVLSEDPIVLPDHNMNQKNVSIYETLQFLKPSEPKRITPSKNCDGLSMQNQKINTGDMENSSSVSSCKESYRSSLEGSNLLEQAETPLDYLHDKSYGSAELLILCKRAYENKTKESHGDIKDWLWNHEMNHQFLKDALHQRDDDHRTPIHYLAGAKAPFLLFKIIVDLAPDSVMKLDKKDRLPLHWAARYCASTEVVNFLIDEFPESVFEVDSHGMSPLHHVPDNSNLRHLLRGPDLPDPYENKNQDDKQIIFVVNRTGRRLKVEYRKALRSAQLVGGGVTAHGLGGVNFNVVPRPDSKISTVTTMERKETCKFSAKKCQGLKFDFWCQSKEGFGWKTNVFVRKGYTQEVRGQPYKLK